MRPFDVDQPQTAAATSFVAISPPLPCVGEQVGSAFVHGVSQEALQLEPSGASLPASEAVLVVALGGGRTFRVAARLASLGSDGRVIATATTDAARAALGELLTVMRKSQHIAICASTDVEASDRDNGFGALSLRPTALPELAWSELDTTTNFLGRRLPLPLLITGMTGGLERGAEINRRLARAAQQFGIPMGVGSQRIALESPEHAAIFRIKDETPDVFLIANLGIAQLRAADAEDLCQRAVDMIDADALAIHVNVLQELIQVEGDRDFRGVLAKLARVTRRLSVPVMVKEVGGGIDPAVAARLFEVGVRAIDCGGKGGTSWSYIEGLRAQSPVTRAVGETFRDWGIPTAVSVAGLRAGHPERELVATGGIRDGLTVAKAVALGATLCGVGLPLLRAALSSDEAPVQVLETLAVGLKTAMMAVGARSLGDLPRRLHVPASFQTQAARFIGGD